MNAKTNPIPFACAVLLMALPVLAFPFENQLVLQTNNASLKPAGTVVKLNAAQEKEWSVFLSNFSEVNWKPFKRGSLTDRQLIEFGLAHNEHNNAKLFKRTPGNQEKSGKPFIAARYVADSVVKYFGQEIRQHQSTPGAKYEADGNYILVGKSSMDEDAVGEAFSFSHITRLISLGNNLFAADADVYTAGGNWDMQTTSNPIYWKDSVDYDAPTLDYSVRAIVQRVLTSTQSRLTLLEYKRIPTSMTPRIQGRRWIRALRDSSGKAYTSFLCANDETRIKQSGGRNFDQGDVAYIGHYRIGLISPRQKIAVDQQVPGFTGSEKYKWEFDLKRNEVYVVRGKTPRQPDLLVCESYGSSNYRSGLVYFVQNGRLHQVKFRIPGKGLDDEGECGNQMHFGQRGHILICRWNTTMPKTAPTITNQCGVWIPVREYSRASKRFAVNTVATSELAAMLSSFL